MIQTANMTGITNGKLWGHRAKDRAHQSAISPFRRPDGSIRIGATFKVVLAKRSQE